MEPRRLLWAGISVAIAAMIGAGAFAWRWQRPLPPGPLLTVLADVDNRTGDPDLGGISELLRVGLEQSKRLSVMGPARVRKLVPGEGEQLDEGIARSAAARAGADLVIVPRVRPLPDGYDVEVRAERRATGEPAFVLREAVAAKGAVVGALERLVARIRGELGEEPVAGSPEVAIGEAVPASPEVWRDYAEGRRLEGIGQVREAVAAYQRAAKADPGFALAHARLAGLAMNFSSGTTDWAARAHLDAALKNLHRLTPRERLLVRAQDASRSGPQGEVVDLLDQAIAGWPEDPDAYEMALSMDVAGWYGDVATARRYLEPLLERAPLDDHRAIDWLLLLGRLDEALERARRWTEEAPGILSLTNLTYVHRARGEVEEALAAARRLRSSGEGIGVNAALAMVEADAPEDLGRLCAKGDVRPQAERLVCLVLRGRYREYRSAFIDAKQRPSAGALAEERGAFHAWRAAAMFLLEDLVEGEVWREVEEQFRAGAIYIHGMSWRLAFAGDIAGAERVMAAFADEGAVDAYGRWARAIVTWKRGDAEGALPLLDGLELDLSLLIRGDILLEVGRHREALEALRRWRSRHGTVLRYPRALFLEASALEGMGERREALATVRRLLRLWKDAEPGLRLMSDARALERRLAAGER